MYFKNHVKSQITQNLIKTLFERAGYRVTRLGVEELFDEVIHLDEAQYRGLNLPLPLRYLPDFLVTDENIEHAWLLEVKFRKDFGEFTIQSLYEELKRQRVYWPDSWAIILTAQFLGRFHQDGMRIVDSDKLECLNKWHHITIKWNSSFPESVWDELLPLNRAFLNFKHLSDNQNWQNADLITTVIRDLAKL
jgi:hypothetical protein